MEIDDRVDVLYGLSGQLADETFSRMLSGAYMKDTGYLLRHILQREIQDPTTILKQLIQEKKYNIQTEPGFPGTASTGRIAILLPVTGITNALIKVIYASFLTGSKTIVHLPVKLKNSAGYFRKLLIRHLPGVRFAPADQTPGNFLDDCFRSPEIKTILVYGSDKWIRPYKNAARQSLKKLIFEGPGKNPLIVLQNADRGLALAGALKSGLLNGGQSAFASERFFVHKDLFAGFVEELAEKVRQLKIGVPENEEADLGPIFSDAIIDRLIIQVVDARQKGGTILTGGRPAEVNGVGGLAFQPTIITGCNSGMKILQEENFGPLFPVISFDSDDDLLQKIDQCDYGLVSCIYGTPSDSLFTYMNRNYRNVYMNPSPDNPPHASSLTIDGGFRNSGFVWEWDRNNFIQREGPRMLINELSPSDPRQHTCINNYFKQ